MIYRRYYFYNTSNVRFQEAINEHLEYYYENKEITCIDKKMNVTKEDNGLYRFEYIATMTDGEIVFEAIDNMYSLERMGELYLLVSRKLGILVNDWEGIEYEKRTGNEYGRIQ